MALVRLIAVVSLVTLMRANVPEVPHKFGDRHEVYDKDHLKQHLDHQIDVDTTKWDQTHERFRYFAMHDLNRDSLLDGTEVLKAYTQHSHGTGTTEVMLEAQLENLVDMVMKDLDFNNDGFIDYAEYSKHLE